MEERRVLPFVRREPDEKPPHPFSPKIVNLYVERRLRAIETEEQQELWLCLCGCRSFYWYRNRGLVCCRCEKESKPPR